jgi:hypothetical protein
MNSRLRAVLPLRLLPLVALLISGSVGTAGCGAGEGGGSTDHVGSSPNRTGAIETLSPAEAAGAIRVDGRLYAPMSQDYKPPYVGSGPARDLSLDDLVQAISPILGDSEGHLYRATQLNYDLGRAIKAGQLLGDVVNGTLPGAPPQQPQQLQPQAWNLDPTAPNHPQTYDLRTFDGYGPNYPYGTIVYLQLSNGGTCTGTYIGPNYDTLITAAHCMRSGGVNTLPRTFTPQAFGGDPQNPGKVTYAPYGSYNGCYNWWYLTAWDSQNNGGPCTSTGDNHANGCAYYDFAVVDFRPCGNPTISQTGTMGVDINNTNLGVEHLDGYPGSYQFQTTAGEPDNNGNSGTRFPACGATTNPQFLFPVLCGMYGVADFSSNDNYTDESQGVTGSPGDSGGPWYQTRIDGYSYVDAINTGGRWYWNLFTGCGLNNCYDNYGRRIDTFVWNFITTYAHP